MLRQEVTNSKSSIMRQGSTDMSTKSLYLDVKNRETAEVIHIDTVSTCSWKAKQLKIHDK